MIVYQVKLNCSVEIRGKLFRAGQTLTVKQEKYGELASQGLIKEVIAEIEDGQTVKRLGRPPNDKAIKSSTTKAKRRKRTTKRR